MSHIRGRGSVDDALFGWERRFWRWSGRHDGVVIVAGLASVGIAALLAGPPAVLAMWTGILAYMVFFWVRTRDDDALARWFGVRIVVALVVYAAFIATLGFGTERTATAVAAVVVFVLAASAGLLARRGRVRAGRRGSSVKRPMSYRDYSNPERFDPFGGIAEGLRRRLLSSSRGVALDDVSSSGMPQKPRIRLRLTDPLHRQQAFDLTGKEPIRRRRDGKRYLIVKYAVGAEFDIVTLDPNAAESDVTHDVEW